MNLLFDRIGSLKIRRVQRKWYMNCNIHRKSDLLLTIRFCVFLLPEMSLEGVILMNFDELVGIEFTIINFVLFAVDCLYKQ